MSDRERALRILARIDERQQPAPFAIGEEHGIEDRDFVRTLVLGVLRWRGRIDHAIERIADRKLSSIDPPVVAILRLGAYQLWFTGVAPYAAVSESVVIAAKLVPRAKGFVNAVLRRASEREIATLDPHGDGIEAIATRTSHPSWLIARWVARFGAARAAAIAEADQALSYPDVLINTGRWTVAEAAAELARRAIEHELSPLVPNVIRLRESTERVADLSRDGLLHAMDEGSAAIASLVPRDCERVLDLAAAPGGKSLALAIAGHRVVSHDISIARIQLLRRVHCAMLGRAPRIVIGDGASLALKGPFDAVLVDAPCSATGTIRKSPEVRWRISPASIAVLGDVQRSLLDAALSLRPRFVLYATCSLEEDENEGVVASVLADHGAFERADVTEMESPPLRAWNRDGALWLTPESGADGFTAIAIRRKN